MSRPRGTETDAIDAISDAFVSIAIRPTRSCTRCALVAMATTSSTGMVRIVGYVQSIPLRWEARWPDPKSLDAHRSCSLGLLGRTQEVQRTEWKGADEDGSGFRARDRPLVFSFVWVCGNRTSSLDGFYRSFPKGKSIGWKKRTSLLRRRFVGGSWVRSRGETTVRRRPWRMADTDQADRQTDTNACERNTGHVDRHLDHRHPPCQDQAEDQDRTVRHRRGPWRLLTADHPPHLHQP